MADDEKRERAAKIALMLRQLADQIESGEVTAEAYDIEAQMGDATLPGDMWRKTMATGKQWWRLTVVNQKVREEFVKALSRLRSPWDNASR